VFVVGSHSHWQNKVYLTQQSNGEFSTVLHLAPGEYQYKFIVDGQWQCAFNQPITRDKAGNENNWVRVEEDHVDSSVLGSDTASLTRPPSPLSTYTSVMPDPDDYLKDP